MSTPSEGVRGDAWQVCVASLERVKQSLRSLEEYSKIAKPQAAGEFERLRYWLYTLEAAVGRTVDAVARLAEARLYVLIDGGESEATFIALVEGLITARVDAIQLRAKGLDDRELLSRARRLVAIAKSHPSAAGDDVNPSPSPSLRGRGIKTLVIINDRPDIAALADADGVHLGQDDLRVKDARAIVGPRRLIGVSTHSIDQARAAVLNGANYLGVGPTFPSPTKSFEQFPGLEFVREVAAEIRLPAFAIGGIDVANVGKVVAAGLRRVAVSSAVTGSANPRAAAGELSNVLREGC